MVAFRKDLVRVSDFDGAWLNRYFSEEQMPLLAVLWCRFHGLETVRSQQAISAYGLLGNDSMSRTPHLVN